MPALPFAKKFDDQRHLLVELMKVMYASKLDDFIKDNFIYYFIRFAA